MLPVCHNNVQIFHIIYMATNSQQHNWLVAALSLLLKDVTDGDNGSISCYFSLRRKHEERRQTLRKTFYTVCILVLFKGQSLPKTFVLVKVYVWSFVIFTFTTRKYREMETVENNENKYVYSPYLYCSWSHDALEFAWNSRFMLAACTVGYIFGTRWNKINK
jgi:hypothetical protein